MVGSVPLATLLVFTVASVLFCRTGCSSSFMAPSAASRTFVLGEFGRLLSGLDTERLPRGEPTPEAVYARGTAIVAAVDARRAGEPPRPADDLDDPWGRGDNTFTRIGDEIEDTVVPFATLLLP